MFDKICVLLQVLLPPNGKAALCGGMQPGVVT